MDVEQVRCLPPGKNSAWSKNNSLNKGSQSGVLTSIWYLLTVTIIIAKNLKKLSLKKNCKKHIKI
jgi:hypothetical protein